jgi:hypothetical protein
MKAELPNKNVLIGHCTIHMREYNPVCNRINLIIMTKSPNKLNSRTCRENLTSGNDGNQTWRKIFAWKIIRGPDTQFADFVAIFIREHFCVYGTGGFLQVFFPHLGL